MSREPFGLSGKLIDGQFRVEDPIGEGGFSVVYRGMHTGLGEPIAIKCLKLATALDGEAIEEFTRRFRDEGRLLYRLGQGNLDIVRCIMSGTTVAPASGALVPYMVLEWLEGHSLAVDLKERRGQKLRGRSLEEMMALFDPGVMALEYAHRQGVVHRDVKPGNLFLVKSGERVRMKVLDFGLAKVLDATIGITMAATSSNFMMCSPRYAAPEQFDPKIGPIGPWTDVYALAMVLLETLRDQKVRKGEGLVGCLAEAIDPATDVSAKALGMHLPPGIDAALRRAVSMDIGARQRSAGELWEQIKTAMRERRSPWAVPPAIPREPEEAAPPTRAPDSFADETVVDPVFSVPPPESTDGDGLTLVMTGAPGRPLAGSSPGPAGGTPLPPSSHAGPLASYLRASLAPALPSHPPSQPAARPSAKKRRASSPWMTVIILLAAASLGASGYYAWWMLRAHSLTQENKTP